MTDTRDNWPQWLKNAWISDEQLLDCDGEKARINGGYFTHIPWPWEAP